MSHYGHHFNKFKHVSPPPLMAFSTPHPTIPTYRLDYHSTSPTSGMFTPHHLTLPTPAILLTQNFQCRYPPILPHKRLGTTGIHIHKHVSKSKFKSLEIETKYHFVFSHFLPGLYNTPGSGGQMICTLTRPGWPT